MPNYEVVEDRLRTGMIIPVSKGTFFNTKWVSKVQPLCPYDMLYHPPDYNPKATRSDRTAPKITRNNIWDQEYHKGIASTTHFQLGRPKWKTADIPTKQYVRSQGIIRSQVSCLTLPLSDVKTPNFVVCLQSKESSYVLLAVGASNQFTDDVSGGFTMKSENPHMRIYHVVEWAVLLNDGKPSLCD